MAVWADLDSDPDDDSTIALQQRQSEYANHASSRSGSGVNPISRETPEGDDREFAVASANHYVSRALRCFPIAAHLSQYLDLNDLASLSRTCQDVHAGLSPFAYHLKSQSLRCVHDTSPAVCGLDDSSTVYSEDRPHPTGTSENRDGHNHLSFDSQPRNGPAAGVFSSSLGLSGKFARCARDLVAPCRKCGTTVCRNCTEKSPNNKYLRDRHRRLCSTCLAVPLARHMQALSAQTDNSPPESSSSSMRTARSCSSSSSETGSLLHHAEHVSADSTGFPRDPCSCVSRGVYLCQSCGHGVRTADSIYLRVWSWRSRYSTHLGGGLGTGLGLGDQGQKCGRGKYCLATHDAVCLMETECSEEGTGGSEYVEPSPVWSPFTSEQDISNTLRPKPGYLRQEIEGIGGEMKSKCRKLVKVGATVYEFRDERETGRYLGREATSELRSWCSWCNRICPSAEDQHETANLLFTPTM